MDSSEYAVSTNCLPITRPCTRTVEKRNSASKLSTAVALPDEIIFQEILPSVPAKSLLKFRCVSKLWCSRISHRSFISTHLHRCRSRPPGSIILLSEKDYTFRNFETDEQFNLHLQKVLNNKGYLIPITSCDGLLVIQSVNVSGDRSFINFYICNPITHEFMKLPRAPFWLNPCDMVYDSMARMYKVVSVWRLRGCAVFTLGDGELGLWRFVDPPEGTAFVYSRGVTVNGALNWVATKRNSENPCVLSMDIAGEKIVAFEMPIVGNHRDNPILLELKGYLYVVFHFQNVDEISIWVLDDWEKHHWTNLCKCRSYGCAFSAVSEIVPRNRTMLRYGFQLLEDRPGLRYHLEHINTLASWDDTPFGHHKRRGKWHLISTIFQLILNVPKRWGTTILQLISGVLERWVHF